ncbi:MAG: acyl-CoA desaturase [Chitinophagaceae bacterium]|nr:acyl-CoA desaturase [Chitinophagaceae bacterium]
MTKLSFNNAHNAFYSSLKISVDQYFSSHQLKKTGNWRLYAKTGVLIPAAVLIYMGLLFIFQSGGAPLPWYVRAGGILFCGLLGLILASIGFNVMHDACHGSYSSRKWVNGLMGLSLNALGGNAFIWKFKHNIIHHTYTNVDGIDDDIAKNPAMRLCRSQKWVPAHRFQHIYVVLFYALSSFLWVAMLDFIKYFSQKIVSTPLQKMDVREHIVFWLSKLLYAVFYIGVPVYFVGWGAWAIGFTCMHIALGFILAIVFQLAHVVEGPEFIHIGIGETKKVEEEWAIHQVKTTANFSPRNKIISWLVGGLNFQVEHHLFPRISHIHYPAINLIVKDTCREYGIDYHEFSTMGQAIRSHFNLIRQLGKKPVI